MCLSSKPNQMSRNTSKMSERRNKQNDRHEPGQVDNRNFNPMMKSLYLKEEMADAFFLFTTTDDQVERVPAHKLLLSTSDKFAKLFADAETGQNEFKLDGVPIEAFKEFLQFFYMPKFKLTFENIDAIMALAQDYGRDEMLGECGYFLSNKLTTENILWGYGLAIRYDRATLKKNCEQKIVDNAADVFKSNCFLECEREVLHQVLQLDSLKCNESQVLTSCLMWAKAAAERKSLDCNDRNVLREELGDLLYDIRFKSITIENFALIVGTYKEFFSAADFEEIIQLIGLKEHTSERFNSKSRQTVNGSNNDHVKANVNANVNANGNGSIAIGGYNGGGFTNEDRYRDSILYANRYDAKSVTRYNIQKEEKTRFQVQKSLRLVGIVCGQVYNSTSDIKVNVDAKLTIAEQDGSYIFQSDVTLNSDKEAQVNICCPIHIESGRKYDILLQLMDNAPELYNQNELKAHVELKNGVKVRFIGDETKNFDSSKYGLISKLLFKRI